MKFWRWCSLLALAAFGACSGGPELPRVSLEQARAEHEAGRVVLIDIREAQEHATGVAAGAQLLPMSQLGQRLAEIPRSPDKPVYLICNTQNRSQATLGALLEQGYKHVYYVHGGMREWAQRGWPMVPPPAR
jgi:rhodanese-related sulfurtransferase